MTDKSAVESFEPTAGAERRSLGSAEVAEPPPAKTWDGPPHPSVGPEAFAESETEETQLHYGLGTFSWPLRIIWLGFVCLAIYYVAVFYVPSLQAWMSWSPPSR